MRKWLRLFFAVLVVVGGLWWYRDWKLGQGEITQEATRVVEEEACPVEEKSREELQEHEPVAAGMADWQWRVVVGVSLSLGVGFWGLYRATYRLYWLG